MNGERTADDHPGETGSDAAPGADGESFDTMDWWSDLERDATETAASYEDRGWTSLVLHTADVTALDGEHGDRVGLSVLVPDDEYESLTAHLSRDVTGYEVYKTVVPGYVAFLLVVEDESGETAVVVPAYYATDDQRAERMLESAIDDGECAVYLRRLSGDYLTVTLEDPALLAPPGDDAGDEN